MSLVVSTSSVADAISKGLQCLCLMRYLMSFSLVSLLFWFAGFETRAQNAMKSWVSVKSYSNSSFGCVYPTMLTLNEMSPSPLYLQGSWFLFRLSYHASC